ncbi:hypothetical protein ENBRE01_3174, partial [Enteropsectra breve]
GDEFKNRWNPGYTIVDIIKPDAFKVSKNNKEYRVNKRHIKLQVTN